MPASYKLGPAGKAWWTWAWKLPQAVAWDRGALYTVARRAHLEDQLAALKERPKFDLGELLDEPTREDLEAKLGWIMAALKSGAAGSTTLMKEMRELDNRLGLNPKALAELRWTFVDEAKPTAAPKKGARKAASRGHLRAVDPAATA